MVSNSLGIAYVLLATLIWCEPSYAREKIPEQLQPSVSVTSTDIMIGDRITIFGKLRNLGDGPVTLFKKQRLYSTLHIKLFDSNQQPMNAFRLIIYEPTPINRQDFIELGKDEQLTMSFDVVLKNKRILNIESPGKRSVQGLFLGFENSAILLSGKGRYQLRFYYKLNQEVSEDWKQKYGLSTLWSGRLVSDPIDILVR